MRWIGPAGVDLRRHYFQVERLSSSMLLFLNLINAFTPSLYRVNLAVVMVILCRSSVAETPT